MKRSSSGPAECSAKRAMSTAIEITRAIEVATECIIHLERTVVVGGCIMSLAIGRFLQQQHVTVRITHHGGVDPVAQSHDAWRDEMDMAVLEAAHLSLEIVHAQHQMRMDEVIARGIRWRPTARRWRSI